MAHCISVLAHHPPDAAQAPQLLLLRVAPPPAIVTIRRSVRLPAGTGTTAAAGVAPKQQPQLQPPPLALQANIGTARLA